jgi:uncharacterized membrane protein YfhO
MSRKRLLPFLPIILFPLLLLGIPLLQGKALFWGTPSLQFIPWAKFAWDSVLQGRLPLWNTFNGMGTPFIANYQTAFFYPPTWITFIFYLLGGTSLMAWSFTLVIYLHLVWAGAGTALLMRKLGFDEFPQAISGITFSLCGYLVARVAFFPIIWAVAWLPWLLVESELILSSLQENRPGLRNACLLLVFFSAMQLLAGHAQTTWYSLLFTAAWVIFRGASTANWKTTFKVFGLLVGCVFVAALISAVQLLPTAEYLLQSQRVTEVGYDTAMTYSFWPWRFLTLLAPNFFGNPGDGTFFGYGNYWEDAIYMGLLPLFLALSTLRFARKALAEKEKTDRAFVIFLWVVILVAFILALGKNLPVFPFLYRYIPTFDMFQAPSRMLLWVEICLSILAGVGAAHWSRPLGKSIASLKRYMVAALAISMGAASAWFLLKSIDSTFIFAAALVGLMVFICGLLSFVMPIGPNEIQMRRWQWIVIGFIGLDLGITGWKLIPTVDASFYNMTDSQMQSTTGQRVYLDAQDEYALKYQRFFRFDNFNPVEDWSNLQHVMLPDINLLGGVYSANNFDPLVPERYTQWMDKVNLAGPEQKISWLQLMGVGAWEQMDVKTATGVTFTPISDAGRFQWSTCVMEASDDEDALQKVQTLVDQAKGGKLISTIVIEKRGVEKSSSCSTEDDHTISQVNDTSNTVSLTITTSKNGWLMVSDIWYPGWTAQIDGESTAVEKADGAFRGVYVTAGRHEVVFSYRPTSFYFGADISIAVLAVLLLIGLADVLRNSKKKAS